MAEAESFGEVLRDLLSDMPVRTLARAISVEQSLVYRWLRNDRVPRLGTEHVANVAVALRLDAAARARLRQAQIAELSRPRAPRSASSTQERASRTAVDHLLERSADPSPPPIPAPHQWHAPAIRRSAVALNGSAEVISAAIELVGATHKPAASQTTILLSMQGGKLFAGVEGERELHATWQHALRDALSRGREVVQLWRLDRDVGRTLSLVEEMLQLVGSGRYYPRYFERYGLLRPPYDLIIIPPKAALLIFSTKDADAVDAAVALTDEAQVALLERHFAQLHARTRQLLEEFRPQVQELEYTRALADAESRAGGRMVIKNGLSALTYPPSWWRTDSWFLDQVVRSGLVQRADIPAYRADLERRWRAFTRRVREFPYRDVCPASVVERIGAGDQYTRADEPHSGYEVAPELRLAHLRRVVEILRSYPNYHLALIDQHEEQAVSVEPAREVVGDHDAFIGVGSRSERGDVAHVDLHITEGTIAWALREHFESQWERIAERHRDRDYVIHCVEQQIALLEQRIARG